MRKMVLARAGIWTKPRRPGGPAGHDHWGRIAPEPFRPQPGTTAEGVETTAAAANDISSSTGIEIGRCIPPSAPVPPLKPLLLPFRRMATRQSSSLRDSRTSRSVLGWVPRTTSTARRSAWPGWHPFYHSFHHTEHLLRVTEHFGSEPGGSLECSLDRRIISR